jgi:hypothetical protein
MDAPDGRLAMEEQLLKLTVSDTARFSISTLDEHDARLVTGWMESLRRWHIDEAARSRSEVLSKDEGLYLYRNPTNDMMLAFRIVGNGVVVEAILSKELFRQFQAAREGASA